MGGGFRREDFVNAGKKDSMPVQKK